MGNRALEEEREWHRRGRKPGLKPLPERHNFPHRRVRARLYEALAGLGCGPGSAVLAVGCGSGEELDPLGRVTRRITGVDVSPEAVLAFQARGFQGVLGDAGRLPFADGSFDYVLASAILHHLVGQGGLPGYLAELVRVLRPGGCLVALEPNAFNPSGMLMNLFNTLKPGITGLVPHERALSPLYLTGLFRKAGLRQVNCVAASYTWNRFPLWLSRCIARYEDRLRRKTPFNLFGWFVIISGRKG